ncbi:hypothetical protein J6590_084554 [Homalodisca vitripennis]|nr:hypothetical protein J6590_084554 [Homalodisca vitripennis]
MVRKWVRALKDGRTNIHDEERSGRPSVITDDLLQKVDSFKYQSRDNYRTGRHRMVNYEHLPSQTGVRFINRLPDSMKNVQMSKVLKHV